MAGTILVVDDDDASRELITDVLIEAGYNVETATHGSAALFLVNETLPDLIVLDLKMPIMDGPTFARRLASRGTPVPIIVITAATSGQFTAEEIGASAWLLKPIDDEHLLETIYDLLGGQRHQRPISDFL